MRKRHISLKGTWEYSAPRLVKEGGLAEGQELALRSSSADVGKRLGNHLNELLNGEHGNHLLSAAWIRHGAATFAFHLVEELKQEDLLEREAHHIQRFGTYPNGYNHSSDGVGRKKVTAAELAKLEQQGVFNPVSLSYVPTSEPASSTPPRATPSPSPARPQKGGGCLVMLAFVIALGATITFAAAVGLQQCPSNDKFINGTQFGSQFPLMFSKLSLKHKRHNLHNFNGKPVLGELARIEQSLSFTGFLTLIPAYDD
jgi:hypothetical protein